MLRKLPNPVVSLPALLVLPDKAREALFGKFLRPGELRDMRATLQLLPIISVGCRLQHPPVNSVHVLALNQTLNLKIELQRRSPAPQVW